VSQYRRSAVSSFNLESAVHASLVRQVCALASQGGNSTARKVGQMIARGDANGSSGLISVAITKPTKEISQSNHSGSHAGPASLPDQKIARTLIPHIPHGVRREPSNRPREMILRNRAGRGSLAKFNIGSGSLIQTVIETVHELLCGGVGCPPMKRQSQRGRRRGETPMPSRQVLR
jgi:hypothetical protein